MAKAFASLVPNLPVVTGPSSAAPSNLSLAFYASGTTILQAIYTDQAFTAPASNPLTVPSSLPVFLQPLPYRVVLSNSTTGVVLWTIDPVYQPINSPAQLQFYNGNPNGHVSGNVGNVQGTLLSSLVYDFSHEWLWVCVTAGTAATAQWETIPTRIPNLEILSNISGALAPASGNTLTSVIDASFGSTRGELLVRGAASWGVLPLGSTNTVLQSNGTDAVWGTISASSLTPIPDATILANITGGTATPAASSLTAILDHDMGSARGDIIYRGASNWAALVLGTNGQMLQSNGTDIFWSSHIGYPGDQAYQTSTWATGNGFSTNCSFYTTATTGQASQREILAGTYFISNKGGNQASSPQRDKVSFSAQIEAIAGSGDIWAVYPVTILDPGSMASTGYSAFGLEVDVNNQSGVDLSNPSTIGGHTAQAYGVAVTGSSTNPCTAGFWLSGVTTTQWDKGVWATNCIKSYVVLDQSSASYGYYDTGTHVSGLRMGGTYSGYGADFSAGTFTGSAINFPTAKTASSASAGSASALPALPQTYIIVHVNGNLVKIPAYNA